MQTDERVDDVVTMLRHFGLTGDAVLTGRINAMQAMQPKITLYRQD